MDSYIHIFVVCFFHDIFVVLCWINNMTIFISSSSLWYMYRSPKESASQHHHHQQQQQSSYNDSNIQFPESIPKFSLQIQHQRSFSKLIPQDLSPSKVIDESPRVMIPPHRIIGNIISIIITILIFITSYHHHHHHHHHVSYK